MNARVGNRLPEAGRGVSGSMVLRPSRPNPLQEPTPTPGVQPAGPLPLPLRDLALVVGGAALAMGGVGVAVVSLHRGSIGLALVGVVVVGLGALAAAVTDTDRIAAWMDGDRPAAVCPECGRETGAAGVLCGGCDPRRR